MLLLEEHALKLVTDRTGSRNWANGFQLNRINYSDRKAERGEEREPSVSSEENMTEESTVRVNLGRLYLEGAGISEGAEGPELG